jgi:hypothetical protein
MSWVLIGEFKLKEFYVAYDDLKEDVVLTHRSCKAPVADIEALSLVEIIDLIEGHKCSVSAD